MKYKILTADHIGYTVEKWSIIMWYALDIDDGIIATAHTKKELVTEIWDMDTRCKRMYRGAYTFEQQEESDSSCWHPIAYIFSSKKIAYDNGFKWAFEKSKNTEE